MEQIIQELLRQQQQKQYQQQYGAPASASPYFSSPYSASPYYVSRPKPISRSRPQPQPQVVYFKKPSRTSANVSAPASSYLSSYPPYYYYDGEEGGEHDDEESEEDYYEPETQPFDAPKNTDQDIYSWLNAPAKPSNTSVANDTSNASGNGIGLNELLEYLNNVKTSSTVPSSQPIENKPYKRSRQQNQQPMYVMDRYGNLYPAPAYQPEINEQPKAALKKQIDADDLIKALLCGGECDDEKEVKEDQDNEKDEKDENNELDVEKALESEAAKEIEEEADKEAAKESKEAENEKSEPVPLTREGLADILSSLSSKQPEEDEQFAVNQDKLPVPGASSIPMAPKIRRRSTVPSLCVHKSDSTNNDLTMNTNNEPLKVSAPQLKKSKPFSPPLNVYEFDEHFIVVVSLPGASKEFVDIDFHPTTNELVIKGEITNKYLSDDNFADNSKILKVSEQRFGNFERIIKLPSYPGINENEIKAKFSNGMLEIKLLKLKETEVQKEPKKIVLEDVPDEELQRESSQGYI